jgi:Chromosome segregation ATPases
MPRTAFQVAAPQEPASNEDPFNFLRLRGGDSSYGFGEDDDAPPSAQPQPLRRRAAANQSRGRSTNSEFQPGAIVRVKMKNFVTYEEAEFYLGPNLNMIIGPNGTGKSSLVCAICLGLGFPPSVLGRATTFSEFVKHGHEEAEIEIELQRKPEDPENYVVGLCIRAENNSRQFSIGGRKVSHKDVQQLMHSLRIQVDNLCQFLPQDRVAEFAGLTPVELLEKTLHATAPEEMIDQQKQLKELFKAQKETRDQGESARTELRKLQARQQVLEADVQRLRERDQIQKKINDLSKLMPLVKYWDARRKYKEANNIRKEAERKLKRLELSVAPALEAVNKKQKYFLRMKEVVKHHQHRLQEADKSANEALEDVEKADTAVKNFSRQLEAEDKKMTTKKEELRKVRQKISQLEEKYKQPPRPFNAEDFNLRIVSIHRLPSLTVRLAL